MPLVIDALKPSDIPRAYSLYYSRMADHFAGLTRPRRPGVVLEAGCGRGQLTLPLLARLPRSARLIAVDSARGPYTGWLETLKHGIRQSDLEDRVRLVEADARHMPTVRSQSVDVIVSNELLCDLPREGQLKTALQEFHRILCPGGLMVHGEWSSFPGMNGQALRIKHSPSWNPDQLFQMMRDRGFREFAATYFDTTINFAYRAAVEELRSWGASSRMIEQNDGALRRRGLQLPFEHVIRCRK